MLKTPPSAIPKTLCVIIENKLKLFEILEIFILLILFSCKSETEPFIIEENGIKRTITLKEIISENKKNVNVKMKFSENKEDLAKIIITNNSENNIVINKWTNFNSSIILEFRDLESKIIGNLPYSIPPKNINHFDTIIKPRQNLEYTISVFSSCCCEKEKGTLSVQINYTMNNKKFIVESNKFYYEKNKQRTHNIGYK